MKKEIVFVVDPMCSWCWGFSPVIEALRNDDNYITSLVVGGLRTSGQLNWDENAKAYLQNHWGEVKKSTGQPFSNTLFGKADFDYDTYPACKAVVTVRELFGMQKAFTYLHTLQEAFYSKGNDITNEDVLVNLLDNLEVDVEKFESFYISKRAQILMEHDFAKARSMGANAFPFVVTIDSQGHMVCQKGYRSLEEVKKMLKDPNA